MPRRDRDFVLPAGLITVVLSLAIVAIVAGPILARW
jgi:hypothetical protein